MRKSGSVNRCCDCGQKINNDDYYSVIVMGEKRIFCQRCYDSIVAIDGEMVYFDQIKNLDNDQGNGGEKD